MVRDPQGASTSAIRLHFSPSFVYDTVTRLNELKDEMVLLAPRFVKPYNILPPLFYISESW